MKEIPIFQFRGQQLSEEETHQLIALTLASKKGQEIPMQEDPTIAKIFLAQIALKRIQYYRLTFGMTNFFFVMSLLTSVKGPGHVMGLLWLAKNYSEKHNKTLLTITDWCMLFPFGTPTEEEFITWWDSQKCDRKEPMDSDNLVDYPELWGCKTVADKDSLMV